MRHVYATKRSDRYHESDECPALVRGQLISDWDCEEYCLHSHPTAQAALPISVKDAQAAGKWPCTTCFPGTRAAETIGASQEDFGHRPVDEYDREDIAHIVCERCVQWTRWSDVGLTVGPSVTWPCTSAIVLGLAPRKENA